MKALQVMPLLFLLVACVPVLKRDFYFSFETAQDLEVVNISDKIPVEYRLNRESYVVNLRLDDRRGLVLYVSARDKNGAPATIRAAPVGGVAREKRCGLFSSPFPQDKVPDPRGVMVFVWYYYKSGCEPGKLKNRTLALNFSVGGRDSQQTRAEGIPFEIKQRGFRIEYDAI